MKRALPYRFIFGLIIAVLVLSMPLAAQNKRDRERAKNLLQQADRAFAQKDYREAAAKYGEVIAIIPNNPQAHYRKGFSHFNLKEYEDALREFTLSLNQGFRPLEVYKVRAFIYYEQQNYAAAVEDINKGLAIAPKDVALLKGLGEAHIMRKAYPDAIAALKRAAQVAPRDADIDYNMARVHFDMGDAAAQQTAAQAAITKGTRFVGDAHYLLGDACQKLGNTACAIDAYQKSANAKPDHLQTYRNLAEIFRNEGRFMDAINITRQGLKAFPADGNLYTDLSWYYGLADKPEDAIATAKSAIQLLPNQYVAYTNLCRAYNDTKEYAQAITACNNALRLQPGDGETYFYLARAYNLSGRTTEATRYYGLAVKGLVEYTNQNPNYSDGWYLLGNAYFADNQRDKAVGAYLKCLELSPKFAKGRYNLGILYTRMKNKAGATDQYTKLLALDPKLAESLKSEIDKM